MWAIFALPILVGYAVAIWPGHRPAMQFRFVLLSAALAYGTAALFAVAFVVPLKIAAEHLSLYQDELYPGVLVRVLARISEFSVYLPIALGVLASFAVPVYFRRQLWAPLVAAVANKKLQLTSLAGS